MTRMLLDKELQDLDAQMIRLGSMVDAALAQALLALEMNDQDREARSLLQRTMKAFADRDAEAACGLWEEDKMVNQQSYVVRRDVMAMLEGAHAIPALQHDSHLVQRATYLLWISYQLGRVADHCSNICERIVFIVEGETDMQRSLA